MELKEGMYVRSKINGMIAKITDTEILCVRNPLIEAPYTEDIRYILDNNLNRGFCESEKDSVKASYNIIDLIKPKDIILGKDGKLYQCWKVYKDYVFTYSKNKQGQTITLVDYQIDRVMCYEQFESMSYKVGD